MHAAARQLCVGPSNLISPFVFCAGLHVIRQEIQLTQPPPPMARSIQATFLPRPACTVRVVNQAERRSSIRRQSSLICVSLYNFVADVQTLTSIPRCVCRVKKQPSRDNSPLQGRTDRQRQPSISRQQGRHHCIKQLFQCSLPKLRNNSHR